MPKSVSLVQQAYVLIADMIIKLALAPGEVVSENSLTQRLSIGRTPVREALQQLEREGLVDVYKRQARHCRERGRKRGPRIQGLPLPQPSWLT